jgi:hypothetical protein
LGSVDGCDESWTNHQRTPPPPSSTSPISTPVPCRDRRADMRFWVFDSWCRA